MDELVSVCIPVHAGRGGGGGGAIIRSPSAGVMLIFKTVLLGMSWHVK